MNDTTPGTPERPQRSIDGPERRAAAMASGLVALELPAPHGVELVRRVDRSAAARIGADTPRPQNSEAALRRRRGLLEFSTTGHVLRDDWVYQLLYI